MTSTLKVDTLQTTSGAEFIEPNYEIDNWKLNSSFSTNDSTVTGWVRCNNTTSSYIGTGMSVSSGVFAFPKTGLYKVTVNLTLFTVRSLTMQSTWAVSLLSPVTTHGL